ncbi:flagellar export chaperone FlgN [Leptospira vanthielii]|uniref:FlgN protein n=1 Tax=Leptospira vanthielii serovar Holland str. Waz Holland = ATCC 700522 TaxID=1218591 RepID=N1W4T9_9LEPT|nr:flagellar export chaperone FlgN [Leptospira vanthielii]EMY68470.1 FlgN protein [Leptospira vanthielii serovar Holland str. Waz Holland = ATCC 700522]
MLDWVESLRSLFTNEIDCYKRLLELEGKKRAAIHSADGKSLESCVKESYHIMVEASELERIRMKAIEDVYEKEKFAKDESSITLTNFLNQLDRESNFKLKTFALELKKVVADLKDAIITNDKLLKTRKEFLQTTVDSLQELSKEKVYTSHKQPTRRGQGQKGAIILNATA